MSNDKIWKDLSSTDPKYTKQFKRSGGFSGTAINPTWQLKRLTELFGPCGIGWYYEIAATHTHEVEGGQVAVYRDVNLYIKVDGEWSKPIHGCGGDFVVNKFSTGLKADDEAYKKSETDALGNAMKKLGLSADVHLGLFDDNKYVNEQAIKHKEVPAVEAEEQSFVKEVQEKVDKIATAPELATYKETVKTKIEKFKVANKNAIATSFVQREKALAQPKAA